MPLFRTRHSIQLLLMALVLLGSSIALPVSASSGVRANAGEKALALAKGQTLRKTHTELPALDYLLYIATSVSEDPPVLVVVHGLSRDVQEQIDLFKPLAEEHGVVLVAPHFTEDDYPDFQRLGRRGRGLRADLALQRLLSNLPFESTAEGVYLFGYSGGAQFAHRFVMAHPEQVKAAIVASAGWYTLPDVSVAYPYGLRIDGTLPAVRFLPSKFLQVPVLTLVGDQDTERDENLRRSRALDKQQGRTRVDRAARWVEKMDGAARRHDLANSYQLSVLSNAGHSFEDCMRAGMGEAVFEFIEQS